MQDETRWLDEVLEQEDFEWSKEYLEWIEQYEKNRDTVSG